MNRYILYRGSDLEKLDSYSYQQLFLFTLLSFFEIMILSVSEFCSECGAEINLEAEICPNCGVRVISSPGTTSMRQSKVTAALLALVLGVAGAHKFYLGNAKMGIIYILISVTVVGLPITFILSLYDFIVLLNMPDADFMAKYE